MTVSEYSKKLAEQFHIPSEQIVVVGEAPDPVFRKIADPEITPVLDKIDLPFPGRMIVYLGGFGPHKNLVSLLDVFHRIVTLGTYPDLCLIMVGEYQYEVFYSISQQLSHQIEEMNLTNSSEVYGLHS